MLEVIISGVELQSGIILLIIIIILSIYVYDELFSQKIVTKDTS